MTVRAFIVLLVVTVIAIWIGDSVARDFAAPGLERTFAVLVVAAAIVAPAAWLLGKIGWIRGGLDLARRYEARQQQQRKQRDGGAA